MGGKDGDSLNVYTREPNCRWSSKIGVSYVNVVKSMSKARGRGYNGINTMVSIQYTQYNIIVSSSRILSVPYNFGEE